MHTVTSQDQEISEGPVDGMDSNNGPGNLRQEPLNQQLDPEAMQSFSTSEELLPEQPMGSLPLVDGNMMVPVMLANGDAPTQPMMPRRTMPQQISAGKYPAGKVSRRIGLTRCYRRSCSL